MASVRTQPEPVPADFKTDPWLHKTGGTSVETFLKG